MIKQLLVLSNIIDFLFFEMSRTDLEILIETISEIESNIDLLSNENIILLSNKYKLKLLDILKFYSEINFIDNNTLSIKTNCQLN